MKNCRFNSVKSIPVFRESNDQMYSRI